MGRKIAYITSRFPHLPETFILREMNEMSSLGWEVSLFPLILQKQEVVHEAARPWIAKTKNLSFFSPRILGKNIQVFFLSPLKYVKALFRCIRENRTSLKFLIRAGVVFPKAVYFSAQMRRDGIEHIHAHYATHPALAAWIIGQFTGIPYSLTVHAHDIFVEKAMLKTKLQHAGFIRAISKFNREYLSGLYGEQIKEKIRVIHCGINPNDFSPTKSDNREKQFFEILSIGSLQPYKGFQYLVQACVTLKEKNIPFRCRIIGGGEEKEKLDKLILENQLVEQVELLGPQPQSEVARLLPAVDCYIQPSIITPEGKMEGIPVAIMEALACEIPVIASKISGIPEIIRENETGYLVSPNDAVEIAEAISHVYTNPTEAKSFARAGRQLVQTEFELSLTTNELAATLEEFIMNEDA